MARVLLICVFLMASLIVYTSARSMPCLGENETFYQCGACDSTCDTVGPKACPAVCILAGSCGCRTGYVRNHEKKCVLRQDCPDSGSASYTRMGK